MPSRIDEAGHTKAFDYPSDESVLAGINKKAVFKKQGVVFNA